MLHRFPPVHLPFIMPLDALYRLPQAACPAVLVIWMVSPVPVEHDHCILAFTSRTMQIPPMPRVSGLDCHIQTVCKNNIEILSVNP